MSNVKELMDAKAKPWHDELGPGGSVSMKARLKIGAHQGRLVIDLPDEIVVGLRLQEGDEIDAEVVRTQSKLVPQQSHLAALRKYRGRLPAGFKFDRHDANSR